MAACMPGIMPVLTEEGEEQPMTSIPSHQESKNVSNFSRKLYLCLIGSSRILWTPLKAIEARDQRVLIVSPGPGHMTTLKRDLVEGPTKGWG